MSGMSGRVMWSWVRRDLDGWGVHFSEKRRLYDYWSLVSFCGLGSGWIFFKGRQVYERSVVWLMMDRMTEMIPCIY
jgi:hypothetical protein